MRNNRTRYFLFCFWLGLQCRLSAQPVELENYLERIDSAQQSRNYSLALKLLLEAQQKYSDIGLLWFLSGELYEQQNLLRLSLESYLRAHKLEPQNTRYIYRAANLQDRLGQYAEAVESFGLLEQLGNSYERNEARRKSGWLLYKLHRYAEAEASIQAIPSEERSSAIMMTLAIIHSAAYNYEESRKAYEQSLALTYPEYREDDLLLGNIQDSINQRALIYYNYALLETDFHHFDRAMELNDRSIEHVSFPSNELLRGELYLQQRRFNKAKEAFIKSQRLEEQSSQPSPLALLDLVQLAIDQGQNREGMIFMRELDLRFDKQTEWMTSYGIDPINFDLELLKLRSALYKGLLQEQKWLLPMDLAENIRRFWGLLKYSWLYWYSSTRQKLLSYQVGKEHYQQGNDLASNQKLYNASAPDSLVRRRFFRQLRDANLALIPNSKGSLLLEEGILQQNDEKIEQSLELLDTQWEAEDRERAYIALSHLQRREAQKYQNLLRAYHSNRAALKLQGIALPLQLQFSGSSAYRPEQQRIKRQLQRYLRRSGAEIVQDPAMPVLRLQIQWSNQQVKAYLLSEKGIVLDSIDSSKLENIQLGKPKQKLKQFTRSFMQQALTPNH